MSTGRKRSLSGPACSSPAKRKKYLCKYQKVWETEISWLSHGDRSVNVFRTTGELEYIFFLWRKARIFFPEFNITLYDNNSESDFVFPHQNQNNFVQQHWESEYFF